MELFVQYESICVDSYREDREYRDWSETWDFDVKGVSVSSRTTQINGTAFSRAVG
jgi:hypothetical protein